MNVDTVDFANLYINIIFVTKLYYNIIVYCNLNDLVFYLGISILHQPSRHLFIDVTCTNCFLHKWNELWLIMLFISNYISVYNGWYIEGLQITIKTIYNIVFINTAALHTIINNFMLYNLYCYLYSLRISCLRCTLYYLLYRVMTIVYYL